MTLLFTETEADHWVFNVLADSCRRESCSFVINLLTMATCNADDLKQP